MGKYKLKAESVEAIRLENNTKEVEEFLKGTNAELKWGMFPFQIDPYLLTICEEGKEVTQYIEGPSYIVKDTEGNVSVASKDFFHSVFTLEEPKEKNLEIERLFLPSLGQFSYIVNNYKRKGRIVLQTYLTDKDGKERRVREISDNETGIVSYFYTEKRVIGVVDGLPIREEMEEEILASRYSELLKEKDNTLAPLKKSQFLFEIDGLPAKVDTYIGVDTDTILEIEIPTADYELILPEKIRDMKEVSTDSAYRSKAIAKRATKKVK